MLTQQQRPQKAGSNRETISVTPQRDSRASSKTPQQIHAAKMVHRLFGSLPPQDVGDPETFLSAAIELFAEHAPEVMAKAVREIPRRSDRPTLKLMNDVLAELDDRAREREQTKRLPPPEERPRTPQEQARADEVAGLLRHALGIPKQGLRRREPNLPPSADARYDAPPVAKPIYDGEHATRIKADLEARRARNAANSQEKQG